VYDGNGVNPMDVSSLVEVGSNPNVAAVSPGDTVKVVIKIKDAGGERLQTFQGVVIRVRKGGSGASFTARRSIYGIGVERTFPIHSPLLEKVEVIQQARIRRAKLYYLRGLSSKQLRAKLKPVLRESTKT